MGFFDGAAGGIIGGAIGGIANLVGARQANEANAAQNQISREHQLYMSNTAHQREVQDLKKAGLNPILSANAGASSAVNSPTPMQNELAGVGDALQKGITSAMDGMRLRQELENMKSNKSLTDAQTLATAAAQARDQSTAKQTALQSKALEAQMSAIAARAKADEKEEKYRLQFSDFDNISKRIGEGAGVLNNAKDLINPFKGLNLPKGTTLMRNKDGLILKERN